VLVRRRSCWRSPACHGDFTIEEWRDGLGHVREVRHHHTVSYLLRPPLLADSLEQGLSQFGLSCAEFDLGRM
jgi:hypothetical protein